MLQIIYIKVLKSYVLGSIGIQTCGRRMEGTDESTGLWGVLLKI